MNIKAVHCRKFVVAGTCSVAQCGLRTENYITCIAHQDTAISSHRAEGATVRKKKQ